MTGLVLRRDSLLDHLRGAAGDGPAPPEGTVIVSGGIVRRNLRERLATGGIAPHVARITTIEELATDLLRAADRPARTLDRPRRKAAVEHVLRVASDHDTPLGAFARRVPWENGDVLDGVVAELNEYHRCTDAAGDADHGDLLSVVDAVEADDPFSATATRENLRAFRAIDRRLRDRSDEHVSRSHLVRAARGALDGGWTAATGDPDWVALATVSALDNPTLRLLSRVADRATVHVFAGPGTADQFETRLRAVPAPVEVRREGSDVTTPAAGDDGSSNGNGSGPAADLLRAAAAGEEVRTDPDAVESVVVPDRRREIAHAVRRIDPEPDAVLVARDAGRYATPLRDVALTADRPYRVETRRELRSTPAYRALAATLRLVGAAADGEVYASQVLDPLRLGAGPPPSAPDGDPVARASDGEGGAHGDNDGGSAAHGDGDGGTPGDGDGDGHSDDDGGGEDPWPLPSSRLDRLERVLGGSNAPRSLSSWVGAVEDGGDLPEVVAFLSWLRDRSETPPGDGDALGDLVESLVAAYAAAVADRPVGRIEGVAVETGRATVARKHPAFFAARVRGAVPAAERCYDWLAGALDRPRTWETAREAVRRGIGADSYGLPPADADAIEVVDAGNAHFRRADRVFVLGLAAGEFPGRPRSPSFVHRAVREAVYRRNDEFPFLYLDSEPASYDRDLDAYAAALRVGRERVVLVRPYRDADGRDVAGSPFLDAVEVPDRARTRVGLGEWVPRLPGPGTDVAARDEYGRAPRKERLRTLAREAGRPTGGPDADTLRRLAADVDPAVSREVRARYDRLRDAIEGAEDD